MAREAYKSIANARKPSGFAFFHAPPLQRSPNDSCGSASALRVLFKRFPRLPKRLPKALKTSQVRLKTLNVSTWALQVTLKSASKLIELPPCP